MRESSVGCTIDVAHTSAPLLQLAAGARVLATTCAVLTMRSRRAWSLAFVVLVAGRIPSDDRQCMSGELLVSTILTHNFARTKGPMSDLALTRRRNLLMQLALFSQQEIAVGRTGSASSFAERVGIHQSLLSKLRGAHPGNDTRDLSDKLCGTRAARVPQRRREESARAAAADAGPGWR
jgi:hypothetical protein